VITAVEPEQFGPVVAAIDAKTVIPVGHPAQLVTVVKLDGVPLQTSIRARFVGEPEQPENGITTGSFTTAFTAWSAKLFEQTIALAGMKSCVAYVPGHEVVPVGSK